MHVRAFYAINFSIFVFARDYRTTFFLFRKEKRPIKALVAESVRVNSFLPVSPGFQIGKGLNSGFKVLEKRCSSGFNIDAAFVPSFLQ